MRPRFRRNQVQTTCFLNSMKLADLSHATGRYISKAPHGPYADFHFLFVDSSDLIRPISLCPQHSDEPLSSEQVPTV
jgi:hypothetical protein